MKKQSIMFLSYSLLLSFNAFAPQVMWNDSKAPGRYPASLEEDRLEELALSLEEKAKADKVKEIDNSLTCQVKNENAELKEKLEELVADKNKILAELKELKEAKESKAEKVKKKKKSLSSDEQFDMGSFGAMNMMSQMTAMMISQQEQQSMMMSQMFSMFAQMNMQQQMQNQMHQMYAPYQFTPAALYGNLHPAMDKALYNVGINYRSNNPSAFTAVNQPVMDQTYLAIPQEVNITNGTSEERSPEKASAGNPVFQNSNAHDFRPNNPSAYTGIGQDSDVTHNRQPSTQDPAHIPNPIFQNSNTDFGRTTF